MLRFGTKDEILEDAGYYFDFERAMYVNRPAMKAFSIEFVEDHSGEQIKACIEENGTGARWKFYFNAEPSDYVRHELERILT